MGVVGIAARPTTTLLGFIELTSASTRWLRTGEGPFMEDAASSTVIEPPG